LIISEFNAPKKSLEQDGSRLARLFKKGEFVGGKPDGYAKMKGKMAHVIKTDEDYMIPAECLEEIKVGNEAKTTEEAQQMSYDVGRIVNRDFLKDLTSMSKMSMNGVVIGTFLGFIWGAAKGKSMMWNGLMFGVAGGLIGYGVSRAKTKEPVKVKADEKSKETVVS